MESWYLYFWGINHMATSKRIMSYGFMSARMFARDSCSSEPFIIAFFVPRFPCLVADSLSHCWRFLGDILLAIFLDGYVGSMAWRLAPFTTGRPTCSAGGRGQLWRRFHSPTDTLKWTDQTLLCKSVSAPSCWSTFWPVCARSRSHPYHQRGRRSPSSDNIA